MFRMLLRDHVGMSDQPNPSTAPEPGGLALPPPLFVQAAAVTPGILEG